MNKDYAEALYDALYQNHILMTIIVNNLNIKCKFYPDDKIHGCQKIKDPHYIYPNCDGNLHTCSLVELSNIDEVKKAFESEISILKTLL